MPYKDPIKQREAQHRHYIDNKENYRKASLKSKPKFKKTRALWMQDIKSKFSCKKCGENRIPCLDFHHRNPKKKELNIGVMVWHTSKQRILDEIDKCDVLCRNCHAMLHWREWKKNKFLRVDL